MVAGTGANGKLGLLRLLTKQQLNPRQISWGGDLGILVFAENKNHRLANQFAGCGVVRDSDTLRTHCRHGFADDLQTENLRRLHRPKVGAINILGYTILVIGKLDRVGDFAGGNRRALFPRSCD